MSQALVNRAAYVFTPTIIRPGAICPSCKQPIYDTITATVSEQMSASRMYCEDCIDKLDTPETRYLWLDENGLHAKFFEWYCSGDNEHDFTPEEKATAKLFCEMWRNAKQPKHWAAEFDGQLKDYISSESSYTYTEWLLQTN